MTEINITKEEFERLAEQVEKDTMHCSAPRTWINHPSYQEVIKMGEISVPWMIERLDISGKWMWALKIITKEDPIPKPHRGYVKKMIKDWKEWFIKNIKQKFEQLVIQIEKDTIFVSNPHNWIDHPNYQKIIAMGKIVIPWLIDRLELSGITWIEALYRITKADPVPKEHYGNVDAMIKDWKEWFKNQ
jgi:hypothetical protein